MSALYVGVGVMSGTSLDGLDICCVELTGDEDKDYWKYNVLRAQTLPYSDTWRERLQTAHTRSGEDLCRLHIEYGHLVGQMVRQFMDENRDIDDVKFIAAHGHTVFHQPENGFTFQLGEGETMASHLEVPVVTNFRSKDVALGGQGSPLMFVGERHLFSECNMYLNLGGICNISLEGKAFDIAPCNMLLNYLSERLEPPRSHDEDGKMAAGGKVIPGVLESLNLLPYYRQAPPKTIGREWFHKNVEPLLDTKTHSTCDLLRTSVEHITDQITTGLARHARDDSDEPVRLENVLLITGGGALNLFLMKRLVEKLSRLAAPITVCEVDTDTILYKEAIILSFIGLRTLLGITNMDSSATGASCDALSGSVHLSPSGKVLPPHLNRVCPFHIMRKKSRASTVSFGSTEQLEIPAISAPALVEDDLSRMMMEEPRRMKRTLTQ